MAARATLAAMGEMDLLLSGNPQATYFVEKYIKRSPFASRIQSIPFKSDRLYFESQNPIDIPNYGDLLTDLYLKVQLPGAVTCSSAGTVLIDRVELYVGGELVERLYGEFIAMMLDLQVPRARQVALAALIGKNQTGAQELTIPLQFTVLRKGLPLFGDPVSIKVITNSFSKLGTGTLPFVPASILAEYTYIGDNEKESLKNQICIVEQTQRMTFDTVADSATCRLTFKNPVKEIFVVIQTDGVAGYDFSNDGADQLINLSFELNNTDRIPSNVGSASFLRVIQPMEFHTRVPDYKFYMYSFCLDPESSEPTGSVNLSRIRNQNMKLTLSHSNILRKIRVYAQSYNFLEFVDGVAGMVFKNF